MIIIGKSCLFPALFLTGALAAASPAALADQRVVPPAAPAGPSRLVDAARAAQNRGEMELALRLAQSAIVADPARPESYDALAALYAAANQPDFARNYYNAALVIDPTDPVATKAIMALDQAPPQRAANAGADRGQPGDR